MQVTHLIPCLPPTDEIPWNLQTLRAPFSNLKSSFRPLKQRHRVLVKSELSPGTGSSHGPMPLPALPSLKCRRDRKLQLLFRECGPCSEIERLVHHSAKASSHTFHPLHCLRPVSGDVATATSDDLDRPICRIDAFPYMKRLTRSKRTQH